MRGGVMHAGFKQCGRQATAAMLGDGGCSAEKGHALMDGERASCGRRAFDFS